MSEALRETVIVVHGTWSAPRAGKLLWHQPCVDASAAGQFVEKLDAELEKRGSAARCWAHCTEAHPAFRWSGENSWIERTHAAVQLGEEIARLKNDGWLCHIVAHSHGGNVAVEALQQITVQPGTAAPTGKLVTLGTPFVDAMAPIVRRGENLKRVLNFLFFALTGIALSAEVIGGGIWYWESGGSGLVSAKWILAMLVAWGALMVLGKFVVQPWFTRRAERKKRTTFQGPRKQAALSLLDDYGEMIVRLRNKKAAAPASLQVPLLAIGSSMDEAWQVLHHLRTLENPLAIKRSLPGYLFGAMRSQVSQAAEIARIHGARSFGDLGKMAKANLVFVYYLYFAALFGLFYLSRLTFDQLHSIAGLGASMLILVLPFMVVVGYRLHGPDFFSASLAPFRWIARLIAAMMAIPGFVTTYIVRRKSWSVLLAMAMGMEGYRFALPAIAQWPGRLPKKLVRYEDMPQGAEQRAVDRRNAWIAGHLDGVSRTFAKMIISPADLSLLLATIEQDQSLVHAAYYTDEACIARIADWIAAPDGPAPSPDETVLKQS